MDICERKITVLSVFRKSILYRTEVLWEEHTDTPVFQARSRIICSIVFELLAYTAEKERRKIRTRQAEGIKLALDKGVKFGRPETVLPENYAEVIELWQSGRITAVEAMRRLDMKKTTFYKLARRLTNK